MGLYGDAWLREARTRVASDPQNKSFTPTEFDDLADAVEKAIMAALIESHGSLPAKHNHKKLVSICQSTGVWDVLPPALQSLVQEVEAYRLESELGQLAAQDSNKAEVLKRYFSVARRLIDYMEYHVIGNDSVLRRLKVA
jgi:HEPN domain-containing protein